MKSEAQSLINQILFAENPNEMGVLITRDGFIHFSDKDTLEIAKKMFAKVEHNIEGSHKNQEVKGN